MAIGMGMGMSKGIKIEKRKERLARRTVHLENFFSSTSVLGSENVREYNALYKTLKSEMPVSSLMGKVRLKQLVDSIWLVRRALRLQAGAVEGAQVEALIKLLMPKYGSFQDDDKRNRIAINYFAGAEDEQKKAIRIVERLGITRDMIEAFALELHSPTVMALDKMRARCEHSIDQAEKKLIGPNRSKNRKKSSTVPFDDAIVEGDDAETRDFRAKDSWN